VSNSVQKHTAKILAFMIRLHLSATNNKLNNIAALEGLRVRGHGNARRSLRIAPANKNEHCKQHAELFTSLSTSLQRQKQRDANNDNSNNACLIFTTPVFGQTPNYGDKQLIN
jgi:hypothetical protein